MVDLVIGLGSLRVDIQFSRSLCDSRLRRPLIPIVQFEDLADKGQGTSSVDYNVANYGGRVHEPTRQSPRSQSTRCDGARVPHLPPIAASAGS